MSAKKSGSSARAVGKTAVKSTGAKKQQPNVLEASPLKWPSFVATLVATPLVAYLMYGFNTFLPILVAPLVVGVVGGCLSPKDWRWAAGLTAAGQTVGLWAAVSGFNVQHVEAALGAAPAYVHNDLIAGSVYGNLVSTVIKGNVSAYGPALGAWIVGLVLAAGVAAWLRRSGLSARGAKYETGLFAVALAAVALSFMVTLYGAGTGVRQSLAVEPQDGQYAVDYAIFAKLNWLLDRDIPYYEALPQAAAGDSRLSKENAVRDGKFYGWAWSPSMVRQPWTFRFVQAFAPGGPSGLFDLSAVCSLLALLGLAASLGSRSRGAGLTAAVVLSPYLVMAGGWLDITLPDWWASLAVLGSAAALLARWSPMRYLAIALALVAVLFRETSIFWFAGVLVLCLWDVIRDRTRQNIGAAIAGLASLAIFVLSYAAHLKSATGIIGVAETASLFDVLKSQASVVIETRFLGPTSYLMFPYGQFLVPGFVLAALGGTAFVVWAALKRDWSVAVCGGYVVVWLVYLLALGSFSAYWGVLFLPMAAAGLGFSVALGDADARVPRVLATK